MGFEKYFTSSGCNCPELNTVKIPLKDGKLESKIDLPEEVKDKIIFCVSDNGISIEVLANCFVEIPLQIQNIISSKAESINSIKLNQNSHLKLVHCDDSLPNAVCEQHNKLDVVLNDCASLDYYKLENINDFSSIYTNVNFTLGKDSALKTFGLSLNGQITSNKINVTFTQRGASADLNGLYLIDKQQKSSTEVKVMHCSPDCTSRQLFKGIADDVSQADFQGHIFVDYGAKGTEALQSSKNMQLTDKAKVNTQPFLEIYNDDVKCSHGASVGQLDKEALFYLKSRGISDRSAKMLLMYAFCEEVLAKSDIVELKESLGDLIKRRLNGELLSCGECVFQCSKTSEE